jgi:hypothetical protein
MMGSVASSATNVSSATRIGARAIRLIVRKLGTAMASAETITRRSAAKAASASVATASPHTGPKPIARRSLTGGRQAAKMVVSASRSPTRVAADIARAAASRSANSVAADDLTVITAPAAKRGLTAQIVAFCRVSAFDPKRTLRNTAGPLGLAT